VTFQLLAQRIVHKELMKYLNIKKNMAALLLLVRNRIKTIPYS
jgi:hypothetical protein